MITANISLEEVRKVSCRAIHWPKRHVINHGKVIDQVLREINSIRDAKKRYYTTGKIKIGVTPDENDMIFAVEVFPPDVRLPDGETLWLAMSHSNSGRRGSRLYGCISCEGVPVVCERYPVLRLRGVHYDKRAIYDLSVQLDNFIIQCGNFSNRIRELRHKHVSRPDADILMVQICRRGIFPWKNLNHVDKERKRFADGGADRNAWAVYASFANVVSRHCVPISHNPLTDQLQRMYQIREVLMEYAV